MADGVRATPSGEKKYKPLKEQVDQLKKAIKITSQGTPKEIARECQHMEEEVKKLCESQQKTLEDRVPLHLIFKDEGGKCEKRMKELEEELMGRLVSRKVKAEKKLMKEKHGKYCKFMIMCQGVSQWMKEEVDETGPTPAKEGKKGATADLISTSGYPSLTQLPTAPPPPYAFPILTLESGTLWGPGGRTGTVKGGMVDFQENSRQLTPTRQAEGANTGVMQPQAVAATPEVTQSQPVAGTSQGSITTQSVTLLPPAHFSPEGALEEAQPEARKSADRATAERVSQEVAAQDLWTSEEETPGPQSQSSPQKEKQKGCQRPNAGDLKENQWQGEVVGKMSTNREAMMKLEEKLKELEEGVLEQRIEALEKDITKSIRKSQKPREASTLGIEGLAPRFHADLGLRTLCSGRTLGEQRDKRQSIFEKNRRESIALQTEEGHFDTEDELPLSMPLMKGLKGEPVYQPYNIRDLEALVKQLPPITEGGAAWLRKLQSLTEGEELALGDFRGVGGRALRGGGLADVERIAGTTCFANDVPYERVRNALADAVRDKYPTPNTGTTPKIVWSPEHTPREFIEHAKEQWIMQTGEHPGQEGEHRAWFRSAVLAGLPERVRADLEKNPDFAVANSTKWERHVIHRLQLEKEEVTNKKKELEEAQGQLLRLQLAEAKIKANEKKKESKDGAKKMLVAKPQGDPGPDWPDLDPGLYPDDRWPANGPGQGQPAGNWGAGRSQRGRGGYRRGALRGRGLGGPMLDPNTCLRCGGQGHWARECPSQPQRGQYYPPQARGAPRGRAVQTMGHQAPNPGMAPVAQYPLADWGGDEELY
ncbi:protein NEDD1 [Sarotherodon galilaeus]